MNKIKYIHKLNENGKLRVCAYARISSIKEKQETSLNEQIEFYSGLILNNSTFDFIGIYADEGKSGTTLKKREQFNLMVSKAMDG
ncbi:MAG: recombinase family protein, partial [Bacteroidaceae bacterium]